MIAQKCADNDSRFRNAISRSFTNPESKQHCLQLVEYLRIYRVRILNTIDRVHCKLTLNKNLFMHTYVHLVSCCQSRYVAFSFIRAANLVDKFRHLNWLVDEANLWTEWGSVQQLARHSIIRETLFSFGAGVRYLTIHSVAVNSHPCQCTCQQHKSLFAQRSAINDDDNDLLCLLLYCGRKSALYELPRNPAISGRGGVLKESEEIIELLWKVCSLATLEVPHW